MTFYSRNLPHWQPPDQHLFVTWRLYGSLPPHLRIPDLKASPGQRFQTFDRSLDKATTGPLWLKNPKIAACAIANLQNAQARQMFRLHAYVIMANHIHALLEPKIPIAQITQAIKGATARDANRILSRTGNHFWQQESFDHWIRTPQEWSRIRTYIEQNPVKAGLAAKPEDWPWSSASHPIL